MNTVYLQCVQLDIIHHDTCLWGLTSHSWVAEIAADVRMNILYACRNFLYVNIKHTRVSYNFPCFNQ